MKSILHRQNLKTLSVLVTIALVMGSCGCGKKAKNASSKKTQISGRVITEDDPYYTSEMKDLKIPLDETKTLKQVLMMGGLITEDMVLFSYRIDYEIPEALQLKTQALSSNTDAFSEEEAEKIWNEYASYGEEGYVGFDHDGNVLFKDTEGGSWSGFFVGPSGEALFMDERYDQQTHQVHFFVCHIEKDGSKKDVIELVEKGDECSFGMVKGLADGRWVEYSYGGIRIFGTDGKETAKIVNDEFVGALYPVGNEVWASCKHYGNDDSDTTYFYLEKVDLDRGKMSGKQVRVESISDEGMIEGGIISVEGSEKFIEEKGNASDSLFYLDGNGIRRVDITGKETSSLYIDWNDVDMNRYGLIGQGARMSGDSIKLLRNRFDQEGKEHFGSMNVQLVTITKAAVNPYAGRTIIELANRSRNDERLLESVLEYNRMPEHKVRIDVHDYSEDVEGYGAYDKVITGAEDQIYLDMLSGGGPDILANFAEVSQFSDGNLLCDLNTFIDGENSLDRSKYFDQVFRCFELGGKLYHIPVCVDVYGFLGDQSLLGDPRNIGYSELVPLRDKIDGSARLFPVYSYERMLDLLLPGSFTEFIDTSSMKLDVSGERFRKILEVVSAMGSDPDSPVFEVYEEYENSTPENQFKSGSVALIPITISTPGMYRDSLTERSGNARVYGVEGGFSAGSDFTLGISKNSKHQKECWDFIRFLFDKENQQKCASDYYSIPLSREVLDEMCDADGLLTDEKEAFESMLQSVYTFRMSNSHVMEIILEESMAYFHGQKNVNDVCSIIQNRVNMYMKERYSQG